MVLQFAERKEAPVCKCNKCGKDIPFGIGFLGLKKFAMPYGSKYDFSELNLVLCSDCLDRLVESCEINPLSEYSESSL